MYHSADHGVVHRRPVAPAGRNGPGLAEPRLLRRSHRGRRGLGRRHAGRRGRGHRSSRRYAVSARSRSSPSAANGGISAPGLRWFGCAQPRFEIVEPGRPRGRGEAVAAGHVGQVGPDRPVGGGAADGVAAPAAVGVERRGPVPRRFTGGRGGLGALRGEPAVERLGLHHHHLERHPRVRGAAVLRAHAAERPEARRLQRQVGGAARNHVHLAGERRHPEGVDDVVAGQLHDRRLAERQAHLVGQFDERRRALGSAPATTTARRVTRTRARSPARRPARQRRQADGRARRPAPPWAAPRRRRRSAARPGAFAPAPAIRGDREAVPRKRDRPHPDNAAAPAGHRAQKQAGYSQPASRAGRLERRPHPNTSRVLSGFKSSASTRCGTHGSVGQSPSRRCRAGQARVLLDRPRRQDVATADADIGGRSCVQLRRWP